uniref:Uncharacterized protein n=1 Tax=Anopheles atroparvus TaxID=41427 RepID=A0A182JAL6_ANOAO
MESIQKALREMRAECQKHRAQGDTVRAGAKELDQVVTKLKDEKKVKERTHILLEKHVQWLDHGAPTRRSVLITIIITDRRANQMPSLLVTLVKMVWGGVRGGGGEKGYEQGSGLRRCLLTDLPGWVGFRKESEMK